MAKNNDKKRQENDGNNDVFVAEYVDADTLELLWGIKKQMIYRRRTSDIMDRISSIKWGRGKKFNYNEAARLAYPTLSDFELALLRIDIQDRLKQRGENNVSLA